MIFAIAMIGLCDLLMTCAIAMIALLGYVIF
jgi:hypothetical protein